MNSIEVIIDRYLLVISLGLALVSAILSKIFVGFMQNLSFYDRDIDVIVFGLFAVLFFMMLERLLFEVLDYLQEKWSRDRDQDIDDDWDYK